MIVHEVDLGPSHLSPAPATGVLGSAGKRSWKYPPTTGPVPLLSLPPSTGYSDPSLPGPTTRTRRRGLRQGVGGGVCPSTCAQSDD